MHGHQPDQGKSDNNGVMSRQEAGPLTGARSDSSHLKSLEYKQGSIPMPCHRAPHWRTTPEAKKTATPAEAREAPQAKVQATEMSKPTIACPRRLQTENKPHQNQPEEEAASRGMPKDTANKPPR